jgi:hypothetical protein
MAYHTHPWKLSAGSAGFLAACLDCLVHPSRRNSTGTNVIVGEKNLERKSWETLSRSLTRLICPLLTRRATTPAPGSPARKGLRKNRFGVQRFTFSWGRRFRLPTRRSRDFFSVPSARGPVVFQNEISRRLLRIWLKYARKALRECPQARLSRSGDGAPARIASGG